MSESERAWTAAALVMLVPGVAWFGFRAAIAVFVTVVAAWSVVRLLGWARQDADRCWWWLAGSIIVGLSLPASAGMLPGEQVIGLGRDIWAIAPAAGVLMGLLVAVADRVGRYRFEPALVSIVMMHVMLGGQMDSDRVLGRGGLFHADVLGSGSERSSIGSAGVVIAAPGVAWVDQDGPVIERGSAIRSINEVALLLRNGDRIEREALEEWRRSRMPRMGDLVIGAHPGAIGLTSAAAALLALCVLAWRGADDARTVAGAIGGAVVVMAAGVAMLDAGDWSMSMSLVVIGYMMLGTPMVPAMVLIATRPAVRPVSRRWRAWFGVLAGVMMALGVWVSPMSGAWVGLLVVHVLTRWRR
jgi:Na+-transporting NADH:ubiquinone oxidoreductase subunit NqrB